MENSVDYYSKRLGLEGATFTLVEHEHAMVAVVYKITQPDGTQYILKICPDERHYHREVLFLYLLAKRLPVPRVIGIVEPKGILMECIPGHVLQPSEVSEKLAFESGVLLARVHQNRCEGYGDLIKLPLSPDPAPHFTAKFEEGLEECREHLPEELLDRCRSYYYKHVGLLATVDGPCITHRDFRPGNLMFDKGEIRAIIDWSSARGGFAEEDFCSLEPEHKESFLEGYATIRPVPELASLMPLLQLSKAVACVGFTLRRGTWNNRDALFYQRNLATILQVRHQL